MTRCAVVACPCFSYAEACNTQCPDEQDVIDRSGSDLNVAVYQSLENSCNIHLFYGLVGTNAGSAKSCSSLEGFSASYGIRLSGECLK